MMYEPTKTSLKVLDKDPEQLITLTGVVCTRNEYDAETFGCSAKRPECGFCKFMKAGPCGKEFSAWEDCLDACKKNGEDFIEKCGPQTLLLRDCVDLHPEYYSALSGDDDDSDADTNGGEEKQATAS